MKKRFIARRKYHFFRIKLILWIIIVILSFWISMSILFKSRISSILNNSDIQSNLFNLGTSNVRLWDINLLSPKDVFYLGLNYLLDGELIDENLIAIDSDSNDTNPIVYIYNTHDTENYDSTLLEAYNISYNVKIASFILRDYLKDYGIPSYVENESMGAYLKKNGLSYKDSYEASKYYLNLRKSEYPELVFFIDIHRDSSNGSVTKVNIDGNSYAKVMFVVGLDYDGYSDNLNLAEILNSKLDSRLTRGISKKTGKGVNGIYNQDLSNKSILLEVGGVDNTIEEVNNTMGVIARILYEYLSEG